MQARWFDIRVELFPEGVVAGGAPGTLGTPDNPSVPRASLRNRGSTASLPFVLYSWDAGTVKSMKSMGVFSTGQSTPYKDFRQTNAPASHPPIPLYGLNSALCGGTPEGAPSVPAYCPEFQPRDDGTKRRARGRSERESFEPARPPITNGLRPQPLRQRRLPPGYRSDPTCGFAEDVGRSAQRPTPNFFLYRISMNARFFLARRDR